jgi:hypothetical protein
MNKKIGSASADLEKQSQEHNNKLTELYNKLLSDLSSQYNMYKTGLQNEISVATESVKTLNANVSDASEKVYSAKDEAKGYADMTNKIYNDVFGKTTAMVVQQDNVEFSGKQGFTVMDDSAYIANNKNLFDLEKDVVIAINNFKSRELSNRRLNLKNLNEINEIQPIFLRAEEIDSDKKEEAPVQFFEKIETVGKKVLFLKMELDRFKKSFFGDTYNLKINVKKNYFAFGLNYRVIINFEKVDNNYYDFLDEPNIKYQIKFKSNERELSKKIQTELVQFLIENNIDFSID